MAPGWGRRVLAGLAVLAGLYAALGFGLVPAVVKAKLPPTLSRLLGRTVTVDRVRLNPFTLALTVDGFRIEERDGAEFLGWDRLRVQLRVSSLFRHALGFRTIELERPFGAVVVARDGKLNFADIEARLDRPGTGSKGGSAPVVIDHLSVRDARIIFQDRGTRPFATTLGPVSLDLTGFSTSRDGHGAYACSGSTEAGETFRWAGSLAMEPPASRGTLGFGSLVLAKYHPFYEDRAAFRVADGKVSAQAGYIFQWAADRPVLKLVDGSLDCQGLALTRPGSGKPEVVLPRVEARGIQADLIGRTVTIAALGSEDGRIQITRSGNGELSLATLLSPKPAPGPVPKAAPLGLTLKELQLKGFQVSFQDLTRARPVQALAQDLDLTLRDFSLDPAAQANLKLALKLNGKARFAAEGTVSPQQAAADLRVRLDGLELAPFDPYLAPALDVRLNRGSLSLAGRLNGVFVGGPGDFTAFKGDLRLDRLEAVDGVLREPFLGYQRLALTGLDLGTNPDRLTIRRVDMVEPDHRLVLAPDGSTNVGRALRLAPAAGTRPPLSAVGAALPPSQGKPFRLSIARTRMTRGRLSFIDRSLEPNAALLITGLEGTATSLSTEPDTQSVLDFKGLAGGIAELRILGRAMPLRKDQDTDVAVTIQGSDLADFSPYAARFLGYPIHKGKLDLDAHVKIQKRQLEARLKARLDQFYLGDKQPSPEAVHLPVKLCLAILRDRHGIIDLDLPVDGSLDDPDLHYGKIIWHAVLNVMAKVATSPFSWLAHLGGGQEHDLSYVTFAPGLDQPDDLARTKLQSLAKALAERPDLGLEVEGTADPAADGAALRKQALERLLLDLRAGAGSPDAGSPDAGSPDAGSPDAGGQGAAMPPGERAHWLQMAYLRDVPATAAIKGKPAAPPPPPAEMEQRLLGGFTVSADDLGDLADRRAKAMLRLLQETQVDRSRLFLVKGGERAARDAGSRVYFELK